MAEVEENYAAAQEEIARLKAENAKLQKLRIEYARDPDWPGTMVSIADPRVRICEHCLAIKGADLPLLWDPENKRWGCAGCGRQINKP